MSGIIQFIATSPEEQENRIASRFEKMLEDFKKDFQPKEPDELLTRNEAKDMLKCDMSTLWAWTKKGKLKAYGLGNRVYYRRSEVLQAVKPLSL